MDSQAGVDSGKIAYVVTQGEYSGYGIRRVYLDQADAQAYVNLVNGNHEECRYDDARIEEWPIGDSAYFRGTVYCIRITDGAGAGYRREAWSYLEDGQDFIGPVNVRTAEVNKHDVVHVMVNGTNEALVEKASQDALARVRAERAGIA